jgi:Tfp pilus assembly protein PilN
VRPIDINLASNPFRNDKPIWAALGIVAACAAGFTGYNAWAYFSAGARQAQLEQEIAGHRKRMHEMKLEADRLQAVLAKVDEETLTSQAEFVSSILDQRNFSWTRLFNALEQVTPWDVKLVSIRPQFEVLNRRTGEGRIRIQISGHARDFDAFLDLQEALQQSEMFSEVAPEEYERQDDERIEFNMGFTYRPPQELPGAADAAEGTEAVVAGAARDGGGKAEIEEAGPELEQGPADAAASDEQAPGTAPVRAAAGGAPGRPAAGSSAPAGAAPGAAPPGGGRGASAAAPRADGAGAGQVQDLGLPGGAMPPAAAGEGTASGLPRKSGAGRAPRAVPEAGEPTDGSALVPSAPNSETPRVEVGEIDGKPVLKPRINPNRAPESGYRKRQTPPPADPNAGGQR